jgi:hypothetical protein
MLAAHAAFEAGHEVQIYSKKEPSQIAGAQFLHRHIPELTDHSPDAQVVIAHTGTAEGYAQKVYGDPSVQTSFSKYSYGHYPAWSMEAAYEELWERYSGAILDMELDEETIDDIEYTEGGLCITSIPASNFCKNSDHFFMAADIWVRQARDDGKGWQPSIPHNTIIYNGDITIPWHRASNIFGSQGIEYKNEPEGKATRIYKPLQSNCDCRPDWLRVGRYGKWQRGVLVHHAYEEVQSALLSMQ